MEILASYLSGAWHSGAGAATALVNPTTEEPLAEVRDHGVSLGAALALGAKRGGLLIAVVVLPLFIPPVVFGAGALTRAASGQSPASALALLGAYVLFALVVAPVAGAAAVKNAQG